MSKKQLSGMVKRHADGFGFFIPDDASFPDVYIAKTEMKGVMTTDRILVEVFPEESRQGVRPPKPEPKGRGKSGGKKKSVVEKTQRYRGRVIEILSRGQSRVVGRFHQKEKSGLVWDEGHGWGGHIHIAAENCGGAVEGDMVSVELVGYPDTHGRLEGEVHAVIGDVSDPLTDIRRAIHTNSIKEEFESSSLKQAEKLAKEVSKKDFAGRKDLTEMDFITIDGATAKDFDDAIYVKVDHLGFHLWVAIADVSHYVKEDTDLDREAYSRGTSTYFPNFVVPMLPEVLSNGICSLMPKVNRLALVAEMTIDFSGHVSKSDFYEAVICSKSRVTYGEAQDIIDELEGESAEKHQHVVHVIKKAAQLAEILLQKRMREGSLDLEVPETVMTIDEAGNPVDINKSERLFAHRVIEEMMLSANVAVAKFLQEQDFSAIFRVHDRPDQEKIELLVRYIENFGGKSFPTSGKLQKKISRSLKDFSGLPEAQVLNILTLRSLSQAEYSVENIGHFGLGFPDYTHFTSPIRRYPDLIVHRLVKAAIMPGYKPLSNEDLTSAATNLSACEQRSVKAERLLNSIKKARFMQRFLGEEFVGMISSVTKFGVFVLLRTYDVDGLVRVEELGKEPFFFDENVLQLIGKRSGFVYKIGQEVKVQVAKADPETGMIDFIMAEGEEKDAFVAPKRKNTKKRGKSAKNSKSVRKARVSRRRGKNKSS